jgi:chemotaxis protein MotB
VQAEIEARVMPKGTSIIAQEFSPAQPEPTALNSVRQYTVSSSMSSLDVGRERGMMQQRAREEQAEREAMRLRAALSQEIAEGKLIIRRERTEVVIQILERDSFASGRADVDPDFMPTLAKIGTLLKPLRGAITVAGHTDDVPIATSLYRSNWDLSSARGTSVVHELLKTGIEPARLMVSGHADTQPRAPNQTAAQRALNRRIDIVLATSRSRHGPAASEDDSASSDPE